LETKQTTGKVSAACRNYGMANCGHHPNMSLAIYNRGKKAYASVLRLYLDPMCIVKNWFIDTNLKTGF
jgi:hypothetical protein